MTPGSAVRLLRKFPFFPMVINVPFLLFALLLLCFPRQWMRLGFSVGGRRRSAADGGSGRGQEPWKTREPGDTAVSFREEFSKLRNYVDLLRGTAGSLAVMGGLGIESCLGVAANAPHETAAEVLAVKLAILLVGLIIQFIRFEKHHFTFFAPIFFIGGLSVGLCGIKGAMFAFAMMWAINPMVRGPQGFLSVYALLLLVFGLLFLGFGNKLPVVAFVYCFLPVLISLLAGRPLVLFTRKSVRVQST